MSKDRPESGELERALTETLQARASALRVDPDYAGLSRLVERTERRRELKVRLLLAAVVVALAGVVGGTVASFVPTAPPEQALYSSDNGPGTAPDHHSSGKAAQLVQGAVRGRGHGSLAGRSPFSFASRRLYVTRRLAGGVRLVVTGSWVHNVALSSGLSTDCYSYELVSTSVSDGRASGGAVGVVGLEPLGQSGLEVVDSGVIPYGAGTDLWWATVAVGSKVARVAAEAPGGSNDGSRPEGGIAVLGGEAPASGLPRYFSVVAESASGHSLGSVAQLTDWGSAVIGAPVSEAAPTPSGCKASAGTSRVVTSSGSQPAAPLLAASSVLASFHQAFAGSGASAATDLRAVSGGGRLAALAAATGRQGASGLPSASVVAERVAVGRVQFLSAGRAEVVFRVRGGPFETGTALRSVTGTWVLTRGTYCAAVTDSTSPAKLAPPAVVAACAKA